MKASTIFPLLAAGSALAGQVQYAGVNIAGLTFGTDTSGNTVLSKIVNPGAWGNDQMNHFVIDDGLNAFRLPVSWQYLLNSTLGGTLDPTNFALYDKVVQGCISSGAAMCIIDVHNYARWNGQIVGQSSSVTNTHFASLWSQIATKYVNQPQVAFGIMNEPHDINIAKWADTVQAAVTAIRQAGASHKILLPGTDWTAANKFIDNGSAAALSKVKNLDGTTTNLIFDLHQYLDSDQSGTHSNCVTNNSAAFERLGDWLRTNNRQAILTETGGGPNDTTCIQLVCEQMDTLNDYSDVYVGVIGWGAGKFYTDYVISMTPTLIGNAWIDQTLVSQCLVNKVKGPTWGYGSGNPWGRTDNTRFFAPPSA